MKVKLPRTAAELGAASRDDAGLSKAAEEALTMLSWVQEGELCCCICGLTCQALAALSCIRQRCHAAVLPALSIKLASWHTYECAGVADALEKQYLKSLHFGISKDVEGSRLLEVRPPVRVSWKLLPAGRPRKLLQNRLSSAGVHIQIQLW